MVVPANPHRVETARRPFGGGSQALISTTITYKVCSRIISSSKDTFTDLGSNPTPGCSVQQRPNTGYMIFPVCDGLDPTFLTRLTYRYR